MFLIIFGKAKGINTYAMVVGCIRKRNDDIIRLKATDLGIMVEARVSEMHTLKDKLKWGDYQIGVMLELMKVGYDICGCDLLYDDTVPHGGGLSSSAAIEVSTALCFATFSNELDVTFLFVFV